eukprot:TRINITY_DN22941_c0_g1_i1.p1 TRINITY_DN22941_c0_g1~~TRINITY_DN22941_c0_g1_i1.p1  ORF type:complete len:828 (-),score=364.25 TRINITY_DN22941_c0_g1_i1:57-2540(-)
MSSKSNKNKKSKKSKKAAAEVPIVKKSKTILKRKQLRLEKRQAKKKSKQDFFKKKFVKPQRSSEYDEEIPSDEEVDGTKQKAKQVEQQKTNEVNKKTNKELKELNRQQKKQRKRQLVLANEEELKTIKQLEKQLGMKKRKSKNLPKCFLDDGLDYILDACDSAKLEAMGDFSEDEDGEKMKIGGDLSDSEEDLIEGVDYDFQSDEDGEADKTDEENSEQIGEDEVMESGDESNAEDMENDVNDHDVDDHGSDVGDEIESDVVDIEDEGKPEIWEDIYGRMRDTAGNIVNDSVEQTNNPKVEPASKYIPPARRNTNTLGSESEEKRIALARLSKQLKGLLNRLAESNMHGIAREVEGFYRQFSRNDVNMTLTDLLMNSLVAPVHTPTRLVMEHVMLLAILHANVGTEVGAHILQTVVKRFSTDYGLLETPQEDKTVDNLILIISYMYSFKIVGAKLVFDILTKLCETFTAKDIDLILITLRNCGFVLRKDDPASLKTLILNIQSQASRCKEEDSRVQFMLEVLMAIKNNNVNKIPNYDPSHFDHLKKGLKTHLREGNFVTELKIGFLDLVRAESRGRWWIVGSAFTGVLAGGGEEEKDDSKDVVKKQQFSDKLLDLARKMRMNTDNRRHTFCIIMTAEDFMDCAEKLVKLGTKNQMEREVVFVLTDCCMQETNYNPYYAHLANRLASMDRKYRLATQFHIWDRLKEVKDLKKFQLHNLAQFTMFLIKEKAQSLGVLKVIEFAEMNKPNVRFLRIVLTGVLMEQEEELAVASFKVISEQANLNLFRESLRLFMHHFLLKQSKDVDLVLLKERIMLAEKALMSSSSKLRL